MPLKGLNVLEFSGLAPLPFVGSVLADFGANVTVVQKVSINKLRSCMFKLNLTRLNKLVNIYIMYSLIFIK